jgi:uncharacterized protein
VKAIADTGFLVALANRNDDHHRWACEVADLLSEPATTCEAVLSEAAFHLRSPTIVLRMIDDGLVRIAFSLGAEKESVQRLATKYSARKPDLADLCLVRMSELFPTHTVITIDEADFRVYRKNRREMIPIVCPPRR